MWVVGCAVGEVPECDYTIPLSQAEVVRAGKDVTIVGWGAQMRVLEKAAELAAAEGISCELIDLRTLLPWDADTVEASVKKTGKLIISHEVPTPTTITKPLPSKLCVCMLNVVVCGVTMSGAGDQRLWR
jgi:2-oxoisovalerate dehydrogenase E1 component beta subunit